MADGRRKTWKTTTLIMRSSSSCCTTECRDAASAGTPGAQESLVIEPSNRLVSNAIATHFLLGSESGRFDLRHGTARISLPSAISAALGHGTRGSFTVVQYIQNARRSGYWTGTFTPANHGPRRSRTSRMARPNG
jgi:hypothetical protein